MRKMTMGSAALLVATLALLATACRGGEEPASVVREVHEAVRAGDMATVHERVDYGHRLEEVLGDIWTEAPAEDRQRLLAMSREMFEETTRRYWEQVGERPFELEAERPEEGVAWVTARVAGPEEGRPDLAWRYRLHRDGDRWRITRRETRVNGAEADTGRFWKTVVDSLTRELGRRPTLAELVANLPTWEGRIRARVYHVPPDLAPGGSE